MKTVPRIALAMALFVLAMLSVATIDGHSAHSAGHETTSPAFGFFADAAGVEIGLDLHGWKPWISRMSECTAFALSSCETVIEAPRVFVRDGTHTSRIDHTFIVTRL